MTDERMSGGADPNSVRKVMSVKAPLEIAWRVFTEKMGTWWPLANFKIGKAKAVDAVIEPRVGGRWYERGEDGSTCQWGSRARVGTAVAPGALMGHQRRLAVRPRVSRRKLEVRFIAEGKDATRVELEHRHLDRYGARRDEMRTIFDTTGDWGRLLQAFAQAAQGASA